ncbi:hypothetical protein DSECCO2_597900 [anaerobic digester metagenome]
MVGQFGGFELEFLVGADGVHDELVHGLVEVEHFEAFGPEDFQVRVQVQGGAGGAGEVVDGLLAFLGAFDVGVKRGEVGVRGDGRGVEAHEVGEGFAVGEVAVAEFEGLSVFLEERGVFFGVFLGQVFELVEDLLDDDGLDFAQHQVFLERFAGDVERQVFGVHHAAHEAQVFGDELLDFLGDHDPAHVEVEAVVQGFAEGHGAESFGRDEEQGGELHGRVHADVDRGQGFLVVVGEELVELTVLFRGDGEFGFAPQGGDGVGLFAVDEDGEGDEVGVLAQDVLDARGVGVVLVLVVELDGDGGAARGVRGGFLHGEAACAVGDPAGRGGVFAVGAGGDGDASRDHEHGVEADAEAADEVRGGVLVVGHGLHEGLGAGFGDGAEVVHEFFAGHAAAGVGDDELAGVLVCGDADFERRVGVGDGGAPAGFEAQLVQGVGGVGHQLAQKYFPVGVDGMGDDIQELANFGAKLVGFSLGCGHGRLLFPWIRAKRPAQKKARARSCGSGLSGDAPRRIFGEKRSRESWLSRCSGAREKKGKPH